MPAPGFNLGSGIGQAHEPMFVQTLLTQTPVKALNHGVVCGPSRPAEIERNAVLVGPLVHRLADKFTAVIRLDDLWPAPLGSDAVEYLHHIFAFEALANVDGQTLAGVAIDYRQHAQLAAIEQVVGHKVHAPYLIDPLSCYHWLALLRGLASPGPFVAQRHTFLPVEPIDPFVVVLEALAPEHHMHSPVAVTQSSPRDFLHSHDQTSAVARNRPVQVDHPAQLNDCARLAHTGSESLH